MTDSQSTNTYDPKAAREQRGLTIAATCKLTKKDDFWVVPSQTGNGKYYVRQLDSKPTCTCPDHQELGHTCKHIHAVRIVIQRELFPDGSIAETRSVTMTQAVVRKPTYKQDWPRYNEAQVNEKDRFQILLRDLCSRLEEPEQTGRGRPRVPVTDAFFAAIFKVYSTFSGRRFMSDLRAAQEKGYINRLPCFNSIFNVFDSEESTEILRRLVEESAAPLKALETSFACDSSGFSGSRFDRWYDHKYGGEKSRRAWVKAHVMTGVKTNVITAVEIFEKDTNDSPQLATLLSTTRKRFTVKELSADMGYISVNNLQVIEEAGVRGYIPFKSNATDASGGIWAGMFHYFHFNRDEFLGRYHLRSNVESTFSMVKSKFGDGLRSKTDLAMKNETLAKIVCHNICCIISAIYELGIDPVFWAESESAIA